MKRATSFTSTTLAMLEPQWQMKTPILGSSALTSCSGGKLSLAESVPLSEAMPSVALAAAPRPWATVSLRRSRRGGPFAAVAQRAFAPEKALTGPGGSFCLAVHNGRAAARRRWAGARDGGHSWERQRDGG